MFPYSVTLLRFGGLAIRVDPTWLLIAGLITWSLAVRDLPEALPGRDAGTYVVMAVAAMLAFFGSLLLHELAHAAVAIRNGIEVRSVTLFLLGGITDLDADSPTPTAEMRITAAGPVTSVGLALLFLTMSRLVERDDVSILASGLAAANLVLALFNMLPAYPLDGGRILRAWLWRRGGDRVSATRAAASVSQTVAAAMLGLAAALVLTGQLPGALWLAFLGLFLLIAARAGYRHEVWMSACDGLTVADIMTPDPVTAGPRLTLSQVLDLMLKHRVTFIPVVEDGDLLGSIEADLMADIDREHWDATRVEDIFAQASIQPGLTPDAALSEVLSLIAATGRRKFLVARGNRLMGVLTVADLTRYLSLSRTFADRLPPRAAAPDRPGARRAPSTGRTVAAGARPDAPNGRAAAMPSEVAFPPGRPRRPEPDV